MDAMKPGKRLRRGLLAAALATLILPATASAADTIYWSDAQDSANSAIRGAPLAGTGTVDTLYEDPEVTNPFGLALDPATGRAYWADSFTGTIRGAPLAGAGTVDTLYTAAQTGGTFGGVATDPVAGRIYWAATGDDAIRGAPLAGAGTVDTLYPDASDGSNLTGLAADPDGGRIYWANLDNDGTDAIRGAPLAGGGTIDVLYDEPDVGNNPNGVAVDPAAGRIYWASGADDTIRGAPLAGGGTVDTLYDSTDGVDGPVGVTVDPAAARIYWANRNADTISGAPLAGGGTVDTLYNSTAGVVAPNYVAALRGPVGTAAPVISGGDHVGAELQCSDGNWAADFVGSFTYRAPEDFAFQWRRDGVNIPGADQDTFTPTQPGQYTCIVDASNQAGSAVQTSAPVEIEPCTITGTAANDRLRGTPGDDVICGLGGNDRLNGRGGSDLLFGNADDDQLIGEAGVDELDGGVGTLDRANYAPGATEGVEIDLSSGVVVNDGRGFAEAVSAVEILEGAKSQPNTLGGDDEDNRLIGGASADALLGLGGADTLRGEGDGDILTGDDGADALFPGLGTNTIDGGTGSDTLQYTGLGVAGGVEVVDQDGDGLTTGAVDDTFTAIENVTGTPNADNITVIWNGVASFVRGRDGDDALSTQDGDTLDTMNGGAGVNVCTNPDPDTAINC